MSTPIARTVPGAVRECDVPVPPCSAFRLLSSLSHSHAWPFAVAKACWEDSNIPGPGRFFLLSQGHLALADRSLTGGFVSLSEARSQLALFFSGRPTLTRKWREKITLDCAWFRFVKRHLTNWRNIKKQAMRSRSAMLNIAGPGIQHPMHFNCAPARSHTNDNKHNTRHVTCTMEWRAISMNIG